MAIWEGKWGGESRRTNGERVPQTRPDTIGLSMIESTGTVTNCLRKELEDTTSLLGTIREKTRL